MGDNTNKHLFLITCFELEVTHSLDTGRLEQFSSLASHEISLLHSLCLKKHH